MTDEQIEKLILDEIKKRGITFNDMVGLANQNIDPTPEDKSVPINQRARRNKFNALMGSSRMEELLCVGEYSPYGSMPPLKVSLQDIFRFWWNNVVQKELVVEEILDDIYDYFTELMRPSQEEEPEMNLTVDFGQLSLFTKNMDEAA